MNVFLKDPVVLICSAIILIGIATFFWAIGKFRRMGSAASASNPIEDLIAEAAPLPDIEFRPSDLGARARAAAPSPAVSKDVAERLESMAQRLSEMQTVLMKQSSNPSAQGAAAGAPGAVGQGFSPETIEKLLKIIGNVIHQVDILQKNIDPKK